MLINSNKIKTAIFPEAPPDLLTLFSVGGSTTTKGRTYMVNPLVRLIC